MNLLINIQSTTSRDNFSDFTVSKKKMLHYHPENDVCVISDGDTFTILHMPQAANWGYTDNWLDLATYHPVAIVIQQFAQFMELYQSNAPYVSVYGELCEVIQYIPANVNLLIIYDTICELSFEDFPCLRKLQCKLLSADDDTLANLTHITADELDNYEITIEEPKWVDITSGVARLLIHTVEDEVVIRLDWDIFQCISVTYFNGILRLRDYAEYIRNQLSINGVLPGTWGASQFIASDIDGGDIVLDAERYVCISISTMCI
jgi:hypothetical protein